MTISEATIKSKLEYRSSTVGTVENIQAWQDEAMLDIATKTQLAVGVST